VLNYDVLAASVQSRARQEHTCQTGIVNEVEEPHLVRLVGMAITKYDAGVIWYGSCGSFARNCGTQMSQIWPRISRGLLKAGSISEPSCTFSLIHDVCESSSESQNGLVQLRSLAWTIISNTDNTDFSRTLSHC